MKGPERPRPKTSQAGRMYRWKKMERQLFPVGGATGAE